MNFLVKFFVLVSALIILSGVAFAFLAGVQGPSALAGVALSFEVV